MANVGFKFSRIVARSAQRTPNIGDIYLRIAGMNMCVGCRNSGIISVFPAFYTRCSVKLLSLSPMNIILFLTHRKRIFVRLQIIIRNQWFSSVWWFFLITWIHMNAFQFSTLHFTFAFLVVHVSDPTQYCPIKVIYECILDYIRHKKFRGKKEWTITAFFLFIEDIHLFEDILISEAPIAIV